MAGILGVGELTHVVKCDYAANETIGDAFQEKSTQGIKTPLRELELVANRIKRLKEMLA